MAKVNGLSLSLFLSDRTRQRVVSRCKTVKRRVDWQYIFCEFGRRLLAVLERDLLVVVSALVSALLVVLPQRLGY